MLNRMSCSPSPFGGAGRFAPATYPVSVRRLSGAWLSAEEAEGGQRFAAGSGGLDGPFIEAGRVGLFAAIL